MMRWSAMLLCGAMLGGCGKDLCQKMADDFEDCGETMSDAAIDECRESLSACSKKDEKKMEEMFDCMADAGFMTCDPETGSTTSTDFEEDFEALIACSIKAVGVSQECLNVVSGPTGSTSTFSYSR